jgi:hypothetical protein
MTKPWISEENSIAEVNLGDAPVVRVNCSANQIIEIDKLYGPLVASGVRIRLQYDDNVIDWVVEREASEGVWEETARWSAAA